MFKCYRQLEHSDCGLTCIRMVAKSYGNEISLRHLHEVADLNRLGMSINDIVSCCNKVRLNAVPVRIPTEHITRMPLPAILYWQQNHFVVLYKFNSKKKRYYIADPARGKLNYTESDFLKYWLPDKAKSGLAVLIEPQEGFADQSFRKESSFKNFYCYLMRFFKMHQTRFVYALLITLAIMAADFAMPILLKQTVDKGIGQRDIHLIIMLLFVQMSIFIGGFISSSGMDYILTKTGLGVHLDMVNTFLERLSGFPLSFFDKKVSSDFVQKIGDHLRIKDFLLSFPNSILTMLLTLIVFSILLAHYSLTIFVIFIFMSILEILWNAIFLNRRKTLDYAYFTNSSENHNHAYELTNGMADLKVNNAEANRINKWKETQKELNRISLKSARLNIAQNGGISTISKTKELLVTGIGAALVVSGDLTFGTLMTLGYITGRLAKPFSTLSNSISSLQSAMLSYQRIDDVINDDSESRGNEKYSEPTISFENVSFKYAGSSSPYVINDFSLFVEKGKVTALVGESGCGKSTLIKLMLGFYIPQKGELILSGHNVRDIDSQDWLRHCGVVMQEAKIFSGNILENLSLSDENPDVDKVSKLLDTVGLLEFVKSLPMGLLTKIGVAGIELSGGQKQRLMIARALYKNPDLLFLDEATSSLDANNEKSIVSKINAYGKGKTIIIAAHRLSTVQDADKIVYIKDGRIEESGTHQELIAMRGYYWRLVRNQLQLSL